jgi:transcriptional regulator GlxA family with amidase domain
MNAPGSRNERETAALSCGFVLFPGVEELDFVGPWELVAMWSVYADGPRTRMMVAQSREPITCAKGMVVVPHASFEETPSFDILVVPGGYSVFDEMHNEALLQFLAKQIGGARHVLSICSGTFLLHAAGALRQRRAATNWKALQRLRELGDVEPVEERWARDGNVWTGGGVSAGIDLTLEFIAAVAGEDVASSVQLHAEYYPSGRIYGDRHRHADAPAYMRRLPAGADQDDAT